MPVIYKATNNINGKSYIGYAVNFEGRKRDHKRRMERPNKQYFHHALIKYGFDNFTWEILKENATFEDEKSLILTHNTYWETGKGYNLTMGGEGALGYKPSEQTKRKISEAQKKLPMTPERLKTLRDNAQKMKGIPRTEEQKKKISLGNKGKIISEETRQKISENHAAKKETGSFYKSIDYKEKMRMSCSGKKRTPEQKERYRQAALNRSPEHQSKINESNRKTYEKKMRISQGF